MGLFLFGCCVCVGLGRSLAFSSQEICERPCVVNENLQPGHLAGAGVALSVFAVAVSTLLPGGASSCTWLLASALLQFTLYLTLRHVGREFLACQW